MLTRGWGPPPIQGLAQDPVDLGEQLLELRVHHQQQGIVPPQLLGGLGHHVTGGAHHRHHHRDLP